MKKLAIVLVMVLLMSFMFVGCALLDFLTPDPVPVPDPVLEMEANVDAVLAEDGESVIWSIENTGGMNIYKYVITFDVFYPRVLKDNIILEHTGYALGIGEKDEGVLYLVSYDIPETVSVSWELFD